MKSTALTTHLYAPSTDLWDWQMNATCRSMGTDLFFSPEGEGVTSTSLRRSACVENRPPKPMPTAGGGACVSGDDSSVSRLELVAPEVRVVDVRPCDELRLCELLLRHLLAVENLDERAQRQRSHDVGVLIHRCVL